MKKWLVALSAAAVLFPSAAKAEKIAEPELNADSAILYNVSTDEVLFEKEINTPIATGSIAKIMTMLIASEKVKEGKIKLDDTVTISEKAWKTGWRGTSMFLEVGRTATVNELLEGVSIAEGNDAAVALAEHISGSTEEFVKLMNKRAKELNMKDTRFETPNGLPSDPNDSSTAKDFLILSKYYWEKFPENMKTYHSKSDMEYETRPGTPVFLVNQNNFLKVYDGTVGLGTGSIGSHYNLVAAVDRNGMKMIAVVLGSDSVSKRTNDSIRLLQYGAQQYKVVKRNKKGDAHSKLSVYKSTQIEKSPIAFKDDVNFVVRVDVDPETLRYEYEGKDYLLGGTKKGEVIGTQKVYLGDRLLNETEIVTTETLEEGSGLQMFFDNIAIFFNHTLIDVLSSILNRGE